MSGEVLSVGNCWPPVRAGAGAEEAACIGRAVDMCQGKCWVLGTADHQSGQELQLKKLPALAELWTNAAS